MGRKKSESKKEPFVDDVELEIDWEEGDLDEFDDTEIIRNALSIGESSNRDQKELALSDVDIEKINAEARKAAELGYGLHKIKSSSHIPFTQMIGDNMIVLRQKEWLTGAERQLLADLMPYCEMHTNAIVEKETGRFMNITQIAKELNRSLPNTSKLINSLIDKGVLYEFLNRAEIKKYGRPLSERPLFFNPEIIFAGNKNKVNGVLSRLTMRNDILEKNDVLLAYKIWKHNQEEFGKMLKRKTYLKYKREQQRIKSHKDPGEKE